LPPTRTPGRLTDDLQAHPRRRGPRPGGRSHGRVEDRKKSAGILFCFWFFLGGVGGHRFYLGDTDRGIAMLLTLGSLGIWALITVFFIWKRLATVIALRRDEIFGRYGLAPARAQYYQALA
jgi:TM2 domain-containing membrane protein YozV